MHISAIEEYGVRCALQLARAHQSGPISASRIAEKEGLSVEYVSKIMHLFRKAGIVSAARGNQGGFYLSRTPGEITLKDIFQSVNLNKKEATDFCSRFTGQNTQCVHTCECSVRPVWTILTAYFDDVLSALHLQHLLVREEHARESIRALAARKAKEITEEMTEIKGEVTHGF